MSYAILMAGFMVTTFIYAICWHLVIFKNVYDSIGIYTREKPIIPIGVLTVLVQGAVFAFLYHGIMNTGPRFLCKRVSTTE